MSSAQKNTQSQASAKTVKTPSGVDRAAEDFLTTLAFRRFAVVAAIAQMQLAVDEMKEAVDKLPG